MAKYQPPEWPQTVYKAGHEPRYAHNEKELKKLTAPEEEGGYGGVLGYIHQDWPICMYHPVSGAKNIGFVTFTEEQNQAEVRKAEKQGYSRTQAPTPQPADVQPGAPPMGQQAEIDSLKSQLATLAALVTQMATAPTARPARVRPGRRPKPRDMETVA